MYSNLFAMFGVHTCGARVTESRLEGFRVGLRVLLWSKVRVRGKHSCHNNIRILT